MKGTQKKKAMYPKADDGLGGGDLDFSQAIKSSNLGEALCVLNPLQQKSYEQHAALLDKAKRRREVTLFQNQRNFFIAQVFGKGLNPHLIKKDDDHEHPNDSKDDVEQIDEDVFKNPHEATILMDRTSLSSASGLQSSTKQSKLRSSLAKNEHTHDKKDGDVENDIDETDLLNGKKRKSVMITEPDEIVARSHGRSLVLRSHTSSELNNSKKHSKSMTSLPHVDGRQTADGTLSEQLKERARSTGHLDAKVQKKVVINSTKGLPTINHGPVHRRASSSLHDVISEEGVFSDDGEESRSGVFSVHTTTDHVGISARIRADKVDLSSLRKDPTKLFPKMKLLLNSYDPPNHGTFNEIMEIGDVTSTAGSRPGTPSRLASVRSTASPLRLQKQRVRITLKENIKKAEDETSVVSKQPKYRCQKSKSALSPGRQTGLTRQSTGSNLMSRRRSKTAELDSVFSDEGDGRETRGETEPSEKERYVKMIQQLTAYLPPHLLVEAEDQISKMSNTEGILKFKKQMLEKNYSRMKQDTKADPRWRRLEGTLSSRDKQATWHRRHNQAWIYY